MSKRQELEKNVKLQLCASLKFKKIYPLSVDIKLFSSRHLENERGNFSLDNNF